MANTTSVEVAGLLRAGRYREARELLESAFYRVELLERARFYMTLRELPEAERLATQAIASADASSRPLAIAIANAARAGQGLPDHVPIEVADLATLHGNDLSTSLYYIALAAYFRNEFRSVDTWLGAHAPSQPEMRARYMILRGFAAAGRGDMAAQLELSDAAAKLLRKSAPDETYLLASAAHVTGILLRELPWEGYEYLQDLEREIPWPDDLKLWRFQLLRALGWKLALNGTYLEAMRYLLRATLYTDNPVRRAYAMLDSAAIAIFANERVTARSEYTVASEAIDAIDWTQVRDETISLLPYAAQIAAELDDPDRAGKLYELAVRLQKQIDVTWAFAHDERFEGFLHEAAAFSFFDSQRKRAIREAEQGYEIFARIGYAWRAGRLAALLYSATHDAQWHGRAERWFSYYPNSPLQRLLPGKSARRKSVRPLSPRQREVFRLMRQGKTGGEIAAQLGISTLTVRNHEQAVMKYYKVHRRYDLLQVAE
jgi:DNA-binding CsgD family transcriptional regulator